VSLFASTSLAVLPWILIALVIAWRGRGSRRLDDESNVPPVPVPHVSVIIPARDEARNIARCLRSVLAFDYPAFDVVVVDDHSTDGTGDVARAAAGGDSRARIMVPPPLPPGWFGKSWACATGADATTGELLLFVDADTAAAPDLLVRLVNARATRDADLISIGGRQELGSFWERLVQPQVFTMLLVRYGGTERVESSRRPSDKIANGQCILLRRDVYASIGGHAAVRDKVAEDLMLAQTVFRAGKRVSLVIGLDQLSTRMYTSLRELVQGWGKNIYAAGLDTLPIGGVAGRMLLPVLLLVPSLAMLLPPLLTILALTGMIDLSVVPPAASTIVLMIGWALIYTAFGVPPLFGVLYPLATATMLYIIIVAIARGRRVAWKGRSYVTR
jgi:chlorobactene glucosyltransferase